MNRSDYEDALLDLIYDEIERFGVLWEIIDKALQEYVSDNDCHYIVSDKSAPHLFKTVGKEIMQAATLAYRILAICEHNKWIEKKISDFDKVKVSLLDILSLGEFGMNKGLLEEKENK